MAALLGDANGEDDGLAEIGEKDCVTVAICLVKSNRLGSEAEGFDKTSGLAFAASEFASKGKVAVDGLGFKSEGFGKTSGLACATSACDSPRNLAVDDVPVGAFECSILVAERLNRRDRRRDPVLGGVSSKMMLLLFLAVVVPVEVCVDDGPTASKTLDFATERLARRPARFDCKDELGSGGKQKALFFVVALAAVSDEPPPGSAVFDGASGGSLIPRVSFDGAAGKKAGSTASVLFGGAIGGRVDPAVSVPFGGAIGGRAGFIPRVSFDGTAGRRSGPAPCVLFRGAIGGRAELELCDTLASVMPKRDCGKTNCGSLLSNECKGPEICALATETERLRRELRRLLIGLLSLSES